MSKNDSIKISPKYGLNPTISVCFFCGEDKNEIALLGHIREKDKNGKAVRQSDVEAPMRTVLSYEPCDACKEKMASGITLIGISDAVDDDRPPIQETPDGLKLYPTGDWVVIRESAVHKIFKQDAVDTILKNRKCLVSQELINNINGKNSK